MVGRRLGIWWAGDRRYYFGRVTSYFPATGRHVIAYEDGDAEELTLGEEVWVPVDTDGERAAAAGAAAPLQPVLQPAVALPPPALVAQGTAFKAYTTLPGAGPRGYEIFFSLPGFSIDEVSVRAFSRGEVVIWARQGQGEGCGGVVEEYREAVVLPSRVDASSAKALFTPSGQLYVRVAEEQ